MQLSKGRISFLSKLTQKKHRLESGLFIAEGTKCVLDMIGAFEPIDILATDNWLKIHAGGLIPYQGIIKEATVSDLKKISGLSTPSEVIAIFRLPENPKTERLDNDSLYLFLDGIQDPGNMGTLIRTADWFGIRSVYLSEDCADAFGPKTVQATMGSLARIKIWRGDLTQIISENPDLPVIGTLLQGDNIYETKLPSSGIVVMGNEGKGISDELKKKVTFPVFIPPFFPASHPDSLNVGVACGITLAFLRRN